MDLNGIEKRIGEFHQEGKEMFITSSFQTHSIPLLHVISRIDPSIPVYCLNTGYLFPETLDFKEEVQKLLGIRVVDLEPFIPKHLQKDDSGNLLFTSDPDRCCHINKTQPLEPILQSKDVWINGIRGDQNANRKGMAHEEKAPNGILRFHPLLDWTAKDIHRYIKEHELPKHPLEDQGYLSIGCEPCTRKVDLTDERSGRWFGLNKTECGLHTDLVEDRPKNE